MPKVIFEDEHIVVVLKPAGLISQADTSGGDSAVKRLSEKCASAIYPVHRLDRETAGVMVFAKTHKAAAALSRSIEQGLFHKEYLALTGNALSEEEGIMEDLLFFDRGKNKVFPVKKMRKGVKEARLRYRSEKTLENLFLYRVFPETGRTHQIRVQFATRKSPLYGDRKYGGEGVGLGLFCAVLSFPHPTENKMLSFSAEPFDFSPWKDVFCQKS